MLFSLIYFLFLTIDMPIDNNKPPDILEEFSTLTGMLSKGITAILIAPSDNPNPPRSRGRPRGVKNRSKSVKVMVQSPDSARLVLVLF